jgi:hypothetical protein
MDIMFICKEASLSSFITNLTFAIKAQNDGSKAGVVFTEEALMAISGGGVCGWPLLLRERSVNIKISKALRELGIPAMSTRDAREIDIKNLMKEAKNKGVTLLSCPLWSGLLGDEGKIPAEVVKIDIESLIDEIRTAKTIIGSF